MNESLQSSYPSYSSHSHAHKNIPIPLRFSVDDDVLAASLFKSFYQFAPKKDYDELSAKAAENFGKPGRDLWSIGDMMAQLTGNPRWREKMASAKLFHEWSSIVGENFARNSRVASYTAGIVTISTSSPAWATQLGYMTEQIKNNIKKTIPELEVSEIRIIGPQPEPFKRRRY